MPLAALTFSNAAWAWLALLAATVLIPLAWLSLRPAAPQRNALAFGLALRIAGIGLLLLALLDPQWVAPRPKKGANLVAIVADNSRGLQISDTPPGPTRGEELRNLLTAPETNPLSRLADDFQLRRYTFDQSLRRVTDFATLDFTGERSDLGATLRALQERFAGQPLAGVVLLSDGNATDLPEGIGDIAGLPPIYPVVIGESTNLRDIRIERLSPRETAFDDAPVSLRVEIAGSGYQSEDINVSVRPFATATGADNTATTSGPPAQTVRLRDATPLHTDFEWRPPGTGIQFHEVSVAPRDDSASAEATDLNNRRIVLFNRGRATYRILYVGGRPNWEFKFLNRALLDDPQLQLVGLLRLALREPKFEFLGRAGEAGNPLFRGFGRADDTLRYDQPVLTRVNTRDETELRGGFPRTAEELFAYDAIVLDDVEAAFFTRDQHELLRRFVADRGGGLLMLGGVNSLESGRYQDTTLAAALPVYLDRLASKPPAGELTLALTREGWLEPWTRIRATETDERARLDNMPRFLTVNALHAVKPGATVLATVADETGETYPALVSQPFGAGRVACLSIGDLWRWGMASPDEQADLARFWRQMSRWLVTDVPALVELRAIPSTSSGVELRVTARDREFRPLELATARITIRRQTSVVIPPTTNSSLPPTASVGFQQATLPAEPSPEVAGRYLANFTAREPGAYLATAEVLDRTGKLIGRAEAGWVHDPAADEFRSIAPNRALLEELARRTGGEVLRPNELDHLAERLARSPAPVMESWSRPIWHNPWFFAAVLGCFLAEWAWRRLKGLP
jgi:uncharacterized membrane protein